MKNSLRWLFVLMISFSLTSLSYAKVQEHKIYRVKHVIDGDTFVLNTGDHVRLIGIDAPEMEDNAKLKRDILQRHLSEKAELAMGRLSYAYTKNLIGGKKIRIEFDKDKYDEYNRALVYAYLTNGTFVNGKIVDAGYAYLYPIKPNMKHLRKLERLYKSAREHHRGLWKESRPKSSPWFHNK
jgi:micrococcal nuclease